MFYDNLKAECDRQGLKITPTVQQCGGKVGSIGGWRKGASPNSEIVMKLAKRLNVSTDYLLFGEKKDMQEEITESEQKLLDVFRKLNEKGQIGVLMYAETQADKPEYQKYTDISEDA